MTTKKPAPKKPKVAKSDLSVYALKKLGVTKEQLTKTPLHHLLNDLHDDLDRWYDLDSRASETCCGAMEVSLEYQSSPADSLENQIRGAAREGYGMLVYYSVDKNLTALCKKWGFKVINVFKNPNSGNNVTMLKCVL